MDSVATDTMLCRPLFSSNEKLKQKVKVSFRNIPEEIIKQITPAWLLDRYIHIVRLENNDTMRNIYFVIKIFIKLLSILRTSKLLRLISGQLCAFDLENLAHFKSAFWPCRLHCLSSTRCFLPNFFKYDQGIFDVLSSICLLLQKNRPSNSESS